MERSNRKSVGQILATAPERRERRVNAGKPTLASSDPGRRLRSGAVTTVTSTADRYLREIPGCAPLGVAHGVSNISIMCSAALHFSWT